MTSDVQRYISILENFPVAGLEEREAMQYALMCMRTHVSKKSISDMTAEIEKLPVVKQLKESNDVRLKTPNEMKEEVIAIVHKYGE